MATFNKLNVNEVAKLQQLTIGNSDGNFGNKFLDVNDGTFTFYSNKDQTTDNNELLKLSQSNTEKGTLASKAETVSFEADTSVTLQGAGENNQLELTSNSAVLKGAGENNQLSLTSDSAVLQGASADNKLSLTSGSAVLKGAGDTNQLELKSNSAVLQGGSDNKLSLTGTGGAVLQGASTDNQLSLTSGGAVLKGAGVNNQLSLTGTGAVLKSNNITFKYNDANNFMEMNSDDNERNINVDDNTTFNSSHKTTIKGDLNLGTGNGETEKCNVVLKGQKSSLTAIDGAQINFSAADFELQDGGKITASGENFLSTISDSTVLDNAAAADPEAQPDSYKNRLLRGRGLLLEETSNDSSQYKVKNVPTAYFYASSAENSTSKLSVAQVKKRATGDNLTFEYNELTYEEQSLNNITIDTENAVLVQKTDGEVNHTVDRLVKDSSLGAVLQRTPKAVTIELLGETYTMKSKMRSVSNPGHVMYTPIEELYLEPDKPLRVGWTMVLPERSGNKKLSSKAVYGGLDVWYENATKTKFLVHNYHSSTQSVDNNERAACGWYMLQLFGTTAKLTPEEKEDPVSNLLGKDLANRVFVAKMTSNLASEDDGENYAGVVHHTLTDEDTDVLPGVGEHVMLNRNVDGSTISYKINNTVVIDNNGTKEYWMRVRSKRNIIIAGDEKIPGTDDYGNKLITIDTSQNYNNWVINNDGSVRVLLFVYKTHQDDVDYFGEGKTSGWYPFSFSDAQMDDLTDPDLFVAQVWDKYVTSATWLGANPYALYYQTDATVMNQIARVEIGSNPDNPGNAAVNVRLGVQLDDGELAQDGWSMIGNDFKDADGKTRYPSTLEPGYIKDANASYFEARPESTDESVYEWIAPDASINATGKHPYISRQQSFCMLAPVVMEPMLRTAPVTVPTYQFIGGQPHSISIGGTATYPKDDVNDVVEPASLAVTETSIKGQALKLSYNADEPIRPLVLVDGSSGSFRVATIENYDAVSTQQKYYVSKNSSDVTQAWIFPNYGGDGGWYAFSADSANGQVYGTSSFWQKVKDNVVSMVKILDKDNAGAATAGNFSMNTMSIENSTAVINGTSYLSMYHFASTSVQNQLFLTGKDATNETVPDNAVAVLTQVDPLKEAEWLAFTCTIGGDDKILSHDIATQTVTIVNEYSVTGDVNTNINSLEQGQNVTFGFPNNNTVYTFWEKGGGIIDAQDIVVRNTLTVEGPSTFKHVNCESLTVQSENIALGTKNGSAVSGGALDGGAAALVVSTVYDETNDSITSATTSVLGTLNVNPVVNNNTDNFFSIAESNTEGNEGKLQANFKGDLAIDSNSRRTKIHDAGDNSDYKFGSLSAKFVKDGDDTVAIGSGSEILTYNLKDNTATSDGLTHKWDKFMTYKHGVSFAVGQDGEGAAHGDVNTASLFIDKDGTHIGKNALSVPDNSNSKITITRATDVIGADFQVNSSTGSAEYVKLNGNTNTFDGGVTTFGSDSDGKLVINNTGSSENVDGAQHSISSTLPLNTFSTITMKKAEDNTVPNLLLKDNDLTLRNDTVKIEGAYGDQHIVITKAGTDPAKTAFHQDLEVMDTGATPAKFFDVDVSAKKLSLSNAAELNLGSGTKLVSDATLDIKAGATNINNSDNWLKLSSHTSTPSYNSGKIGNLQFTSDGNSGQVAITGGTFSSQNTKWNVISPANDGFLTIDTQGDGEFKAGNLESSTIDGVKINGNDNDTAMYVPNTGAITITRDVSMGNNKLTVKDFEVKGTMTTLNSQEVNIGDSNMLLNAFNTTDAAKGAGILVNCMATGGGMAGSCTATGFDSDTKKFSGVANVNGSGINDDAIIMVVARNGTDPVNSSIVESNMNGIWMAGGVATNDNPLTVKAGTNAQFVKNPSTTPDALPDGAVYHITRVMVHHLKFDMHTGSMSEGGSVFYGHGSQDDHFGGDYGYRDMMMGDIHSSVHEVTTNNETMTGAITHIPSTISVVSSINLHSTPKSGATYKLVNSQNNPVTVSGNNDFSCLVNAGGHGSFTYIKDKWYEQV